MDRIVLAYSGGPSSSVAIPWLREQQQAEVVTVSVDLGQHESLDGIRARALASGAVRAHVLDRRDEFAREYLLPAIESGALDSDAPAIVAALSRPLIAKALVELAHIEGATAVAHAATGPQDRERLAAAVAALDPTLRVIDATVDWTFDAQGMAEYARERGIPFAAPSSTPDPLAAIKADAATHPIFVHLDFRGGVPVKINGIEMDLVELMASLETIADAQATSGAAVLRAAYNAKQSGVPADVKIFNGVCEVVTRGN
ncbi:MAG: argininosuccinate synthase [Planctomycetes bacterium]|nr:argininosuccinate synthase [Planctomycetota bacterium]